MGIGGSRGGGKKPGGKSVRGVAGYAPVQRKRTAPGKRTRTMALAAADPSPVQRKAATDAPDHDGAGEAGHASEDRAAPAQPAAPSSGGSQLPDGVRSKMEGSFGADFSGVRVGEDARAAEMGAQAYTQGSSILFAPGELNPGTARGQELIGHELTHVIQQSQGRVAADGQAKDVEVNQDPALEREADEQGARAARGERVDGAASAAVSATKAGDAPVQAKLKLTGRRAEVNAAVRLMNASMLGHKAKANRRGYVRLVESPARSGKKASEGQSAMYQHLKTIIDDPKDTVVKMNSRDKKAIGGHYGRGVVSMADVGLFGTEGGMTSQGVLIHELVEQFEKQSTGMGYGNTQDGAHGMAMVAEDDVNQSTRGVSRTVSYTPHSDGTFDAVVEVPYRFKDGSVKTTTMHIVKGDLIKVTHKDTKKADAPKKD